MSRPQCLTGATAKSDRPAHNTSNGLRKTMACAYEPEPGGSEPIVRAASIVQSRAGCLSLHAFEHFSIDVRWSLPCKLSLLERGTQQYMGGCYGLVVKRQTCRGTDFGD